jgi:hypothetical protein
MLQAEEDKNGDLVQKAESLRVGVGLVRQVCRGKPQDLRTAEGHCQA